MNFAESEKYLLSLGNEVSAMKLGLENIRTLLAALDNPQNNFLKVQVAGTNGKGSVCAFLDSICVRAGIKTGLFTSPHLISITERIKVGGVEISELDFARHASKIRVRCEGLVAARELESIPTFFEQITAIALSVFAEEKVDFAILETGLGGRLDATTAANAEIVAITSIDYDHQEYLGETLTEIAGEKAAIIRADTRVVVAEQKIEAEQVIGERCREAGVEPNFADRVYPDIILGLLGKHQQENAAVAVGIVEELRKIKFLIPDDKVRLGLETARHPGRLEYIDNILFDGAHNVAGAKALREYLDEFVSQPITMIFGAMKDKDLAEITSILFPSADELILVEAANTRSSKLGDLQRFVFKRTNVFFAKNVADAIKIGQSFPEHLTCITGSLYLIGEAKSILTHRHK